jgi:hypothetical protein
MYQIPHVDIARVCHEANRAYCQTIGDDSQPTWDDAPDWQKQSAINGVVFHLWNPNAGPDASHNNWLKLKQDEGWIWGVVKDPAAKIHPCILPFEQLPIEQQVKDYLFKSVVEGLRALAAPFPPQAALVPEEAVAEPIPAVIEDKPVQSETN